MYVQGLQGLDDAQDLMRNNNNNNNNNNNSNINNNNKLYFMRVTLYS